MYILGISALYHDSAAALICNGEIIAAAQEERFSRKKHDLSIPCNAIQYCLKAACITAEDIDYVVYYDNPLITLDRFLKNVILLGVESRKLIDRSCESLFTNKIWIHKGIEEALGGYLGKHGKLMTVNHHMSHAASAFYPSPFNEAVVIINDGVGEWATTSIGIGHGNELELKEEIRYPHSLGLLYSAFTYFCGFKVNSGDYKFMGLAPYGKPIYYDTIINNLIDIKEDGSYNLNMEYFDYHKGGAMTNEKFEQLFGGARRAPESEITKREMDIAASGQKVIEDILLRMVAYAKRKWGSKINNLVLAGGVALNCVANGIINRAGIFENIWIQPAAGDAGGALGCALYLYYGYLKNQRIADINDSQKGSYLGSEFTEQEISDSLEEKKAVYHICSSYDEIDIEIAQYLSEGKIIGLCNGRMEFGPRALGNRSIIADPRFTDMQSKMNLKIKYRESFRPFAPSVLRERVNDYFELDADSPYMLLVDSVKKNGRKEFDLERLLYENNMDMLTAVNAVRSEIPAVTHVDYSARIQTVDKKRNPRYYHIIKEFENRTGCSVIVNTSFNVRGEPIVRTPQEAYDCFMRTEMDVLVVDKYILLKEEQPAFQDSVNWEKIFELD